MGLLRRFFIGGRTPHGDTECIRTLTIIVHSFLFQKFSRKHGLKTGSMLAPLVSNALFSMEPANSEEGLRFLQCSAELFDAELRDLSQLPELCYIVSLATHVLAELPGRERPPSPDQAKRARALRQMGILLPREAIRIPTSSREFMRVVKRFGRWAGAS